MAFLMIGSVLTGCGSKEPKRLHGFKTVRLGKATIKVDPHWKWKEFKATKPARLYAGGTPLDDLHRLYEIPGGRMELYAGETTLSDANQWLQQASALISNRRGLDALRYETKVRVRSMHGAKSTVAQWFGYRDGATAHCVQEELGLRGGNYFLVRADTRGDCQRGWKDLDDVIAGVHIRA